MAKDSAALPRFTIPWSLIPMKLLVGAVVLSTLVREFFPLSYFAMYAGMYPSADYVYVTDLSGEPIALQTETHTRTAHLKRAHHAYYLEELERLGGSHRSEQAAAIAGKRVMQWLVDDGPRKEELRETHDGLRLVRVDLTLNVETGEVEQDEQVLGVCAAGGAAA